ncbi:MAG: hypothetical protein ACKOE4_03410 [Candidatus Kapaibacterium sp.]
MATHFIIYVITALVMALPSRGRAQLQLQSHVIGCGGSIESSFTPGDVALSGTIGQVLNSSRFVLNSVYLFEGFWVPWQFEVVSVGELRESAGRLNAFPNPFSARVTVRIPHTMSGDLQVVMFSITGERMRQMSVTASATTETTVVIDAKDDNGMSLPTGLYVIEVRGSLLSGQRASMHQIVHLIQ